MPLITKEFEKHILECLKDAIETESVNLFDDIVEENPDYWATQLNNIFKTQITKALKDKKFLREVLTQILEDQYGVEDIIKDVLKDGLRSGKWLNRIIKS